MSEQLDYEKAYWFAKGTCENVNYINTPCGNKIVVGRTMDDQYIVVIIPDEVTIATPYLGKFGLGNNKGKLVIKGGTNVKIADSMLDGIFKSSIDLEPVNMPNCISFINFLRNARISNELRIKSDIMASGKWLDRAFENTMVYGGGFKDPDIRNFDGTIYVDGEPAETLERSRIIDLKTPNVVGSFEIWKNSNVRVRLHRG